MTPTKDSKSNEKTKKKHLRKEEPEVIVSGSSIIEVGGQRSKNKKPNNLAFLYQ